MEHEPSYRDAKYQECRRKPVNHKAVVKAAHILIKSILNIRCILNVSLNTRE